MTGTVSVGGGSEGGVGAAPRFGQGATALGGGLSLPMGGGASGRVEGPGSPNENKQGQQSWREGGQRCQSAWTRLKPRAEGPGSRSGHGCRLTVGQGASGASETRARPAAKAVATDGPGCRPPPARAASPGFLRPQEGVMVCAARARGGVGEARTRDPPARPTGPSAAREQSDRQRGVTSALVAAA